METIKVTVELPIDMVTDFMEFVTAFKGCKAKAIEYKPKAIEEEKEENNTESIDLDSQPTGNRSGKPKDIEEVRKYILDNDLNVNVDKFYRYYSDRNWKDGKGEEIQDWKAILESWHKREWKMGKQQEALRRKNNQLQHHEPAKWTPESDTRRLYEKLKQEGKV